MGRKAFTLVELLIVVIILGILAAVVIPQFSDASEDARLSSLTTNLQTIRGQIELYHIQYGVYPPEATFGTVMTTTPVSGNWKAECEYGVWTATSSGFLNTVVVMKKISKRKAMSTIGVISMETGIRRFFGAAINALPNG